MNISQLRLIDAEEMAVNDFPVSFKDQQALSMFSDNVWDFSAQISNRNCKRADMEIVFNQKLKNGVDITSNELDSLLISVKGFLYARLTRPHPRTGKVLKPRTAVGVWFRLRSLLSWMIDNDLSSFREVTTEKAQTYRSFILSMEQAPNTTLKKLSILEMLYQYTDYYSDGIEENPWPDETSVSISGDRKNPDIAINQTSEIPDDTYNKLGSVCLSLLESDSLKIIQAHEECCDELRNHRPIAIERLKTGKAKPFGREYEFQIEYCSSRAIRNRLDDIANRFGFKSYGVLNDSVQDLHTACYVICAMFSGMRDSELASLEIGAYIRRTDIGGLRTGWLKGITYKMEEMPCDAEWMVPDCVEKAVSIAECVSQFNRENMVRQIDRLIANPDEESHSRLHELEDWRNSLFLVKGNNAYTYRAMDNSTANSRLKRFARKYNITCHNGQIFPLATHQFRRKFAILVAKNIMGDLRYLRHHFKHWSMDMSLYYARHKRADDSLISEVMSERDKLTRIIVSDWLTGDSNLEGKRGKAITSFKERNTIKTSKNKDDAIANLADGTFIRATGHSWCLSNADTCGGQGLYDSLQCANCDNAVIDKSLIPAWKGIRDQQMEILDLEDVGISVKHLAKQHIEKANAIIRNLSND